MEEKELSQSLDRMSAFLLSEETLDQILGLVAAARSFEHFRSRRRWHHTEARRRRDHRRPQRRVRGGGRQPAVCGGARSLPVGYRRGA